MEYCRIRRNTYDDAADPQQPCLARNTHTSTPNTTISTYTSRAGQIHTLKVCSLTFLEIPVPDISRLTYKLTPSIASREEANGLRLGMRECFRKQAHEDSTNTGCLVPVFPFRHKHRFRNMPGMRASSMCILSDYENTGPVEFELVAEARRGAL